MYMYLSFKDIEASVKPKEAWLFLSKTKFIREDFKMAAGSRTNLQTGVSYSYYNGIVNLC